MPGHMDKGTKNYRNMMKRMEGMDMAGPMSDEEQALLSKISNDARLMMRNSGSGSTSDAEFKAFKDAVEGSAMAGMAKMGMDMAKGNMLDTQKEMLDTEKESMMKMLEGMDFAPSDIREAIKELMDMGFDKDAVLEILESTPNLVGAIGKPETNPRTMTEGAISSQKRPMMEEMSGSGGALGGIPFDADRTQSMDMQKERMGT